MIIRIFDKMMRELYRLFHPQLWGHHMQINGIPRIYGIEKLKLGQNVSVNAGCVLQCYGKLTIGNNVTVSDGAKILTRSLRTDGYAANAKKNRTGSHRKGDTDRGRCVDRVKCCDPPRCDHS